MTASLRSVVVMPGGGRRVRLPDRGAEATFKVAGDETGGRLAIVESAPAPGAPGLPPHRHRRSDEALYVLEGELAVRVGRRTVQAPAGSFIFIPRGTVHAFSNPGPAAARVLVIFAPAGLEQFLEETAELYRRDRSRGSAEEEQRSGVSRAPDPPRLAALRNRHDTEIVGARQGVRPGTRGSRREKRRA